MGFLFAGGASGAGAGAAGASGAAAGAGAAAGTAATSAAAGSGLGATLGSAAAGTAAAQALGSGMSQGMSDVMSGVASAPVGGVASAAPATTQTATNSVATTDKVGQYLDWAAKVNNALKGAQQLGPAAPVGSLGSPQLASTQQQSAPQAFPVSALSSIRR